MSNTIRTGRVSSVNYKEGTYEVTYFDRGKSVTRAVNAMSNGEYQMPSVGQVVSVSHNSNGQTAATTTGTVWNRSNKPAEGYEGLYRKEYAPSEKGKAYERYDANTGVYTQYTNTRTGRNCKGTIYDEAGGAAYFTASGLVMLESRGASLSAQAKTGVGISAGTTVSVEAGSTMSLEAGTLMSISAGGKQIVTIGGKSEQTYKGDVTIKMKAKESKEVTGDSEQKVEGDLKTEVTGNTEQTFTGDLTMDVVGTLTLTVGGATITIDPGGNVTVDAPQVDVTAAAGDVTIEGISLKNHKHTGNSGRPTSAPLP